MKVVHSKNVDFNEVVREVIQFEYGLKLSVESEIIDSGARIRFDFCDREQNTYVEIIEKNKSNRVKSIAKQLRVIKDSILQIPYSTIPSLFVIFNFSLEEDEKVKIFKEVDTEGEVKLLLFDFYNIKALAKKYDVDFDDGLVQDKTKRNLDNYRFKNSEINSILNIERNFFAAGHFWERENQLDRFIQESIWENGHKNKFQRVVNKAYYHLAS